MTTSPLFLVLAALLATVMAALNIHYNRKTAKTKATLDLILSHQESSYREQLAKEFRQYREQKPALLQLVADKHSAMKNSKARVFEFLNYYEALCVGFDNDILDQAFYLQYWKTAFIKDYDTAKEFIETLRIVDNNKNIYEAFSRYAESWSKNKLHSPKKKWHAKCFSVVPVTLFFATLLIVAGVYHAS